MLVAFATVVACGARTQLPTPDACEPLDEDLEAVTADLDMHLLLDSSGSMEDVTPAGTTKWNAVVGALQVFFASPDASGLGVGLSCFPVLDPNVPEECTGNVNACGLPDACAQVGLCIDSGTSCDVSVGCMDSPIPDEVCTPIGVCANTPDAYCAPSIGAQCLPEQGECLLLGVCENRASCEVGVYEAPLVPVQTLPAVGDDLLATMHQRVPEGGTSTLPALVGVHAQAQVGASERPERRQAVVLATDGFPTACDSTLDDGDDQLAVRHLAEVAEEAAVKGVRTFVVGVFGEAEAEAAQENLDTIARAGGTERAFVVGAEEALTADFARALEEARVSASSCEYDLPIEVVQPSEASPALERATITLRLTTGERALELLPSASACTDGRAGAYILGETSAPRLILCPSICAAAVEDGLPPITLRGGCLVEQDPP